MSFDYRNTGREYRSLIKLPSELYSDIIEREKYYNGKQLIDIYNLPQKYISYYNTISRDTININSRKTDYLNNTSTNIESVKNESLIADNNIKEEIDIIKSKLDNYQIQIDQLKINDNNLQQQIDVIKNDLLEELKRRVNIVDDFRIGLTE